MGEAEDAKGHGLSGLDGPLTPVLSPTRGEGALCLRIAAIVASPKPGAAPKVRTSPAFAARFEAEANRSGLDVDIAEKEPEQLFKLCSVCGAQNSNFVTACFNCQSELEAREQRPQVVRRKKFPEARWLTIISTPKPSRLPLIKVPLVHARFAPPPPPPPVTGAQVLGRFLSVFVEREPPAPKNAARFDNRSVLDKFLSVFVERE